MPLQVYCCSISGCGSVLVIRRIGPLNLLFLFLIVCAFGLTSSKRAVNYLTDLMDGADVGILGLRMSLNENKTKHIYIYYDGR